MGEERNLKDGDPFLGRVVGDRYRVVAALARGGMGRVYRAVQEPLGRDVALKILDIQELRDSTGGDAAGKGFADRFFLEAASVAKLSHPNTVTVHDYGTMEDGACFIAMELLHGRTLGELISADAPLAPRRALRIGLQICASLSEAHGQGLVHRDLKPGNVMLIEHGADREFVKVLDFGLVKRENEESDLTASGALVGTPKYMAPEQVTGEGVGQWSDVYALGAVLYHMLTGQPPFVGDSKFALLAAHMNVEPTPMAEKTPGLDVPPGLEAVVMKCLKKAPKDRFASMEKLAEALVLCGDASALPLSSSLPSSDSLRILLDSGGFPPPAASGERPMVRVDTAPTGMVARPSSARRGAIAAALLLPALALGTWAYASGRDVPGRAEAHSTPRAEPQPSTPQFAEPPEETLDPQATDTVQAPSPPLGIEQVRSEPAGQVRVVLASEPPGAHARHGEFDLGDTPVTLVIPEGETWTIRLSAPGYVSRTVTATRGQGEVRARLSRARARRPPTGDHAETPEPTQTETPRVEVGMTSGHTDNRDPWANP